MGAAVQFNSPSRCTLKLLSKDSEGPEVGAQNRCPNPRVLGGRAACGRSTFPKFVLARAGPWSIEFKRAWRHSGARCARMGKVVAARRSTVDWQASLLGFATG